MAQPPLFVALGTRRYRIERPFAPESPLSGRVSDVCCDERGHVFVALRNDPYKNPERAAVIEFRPTGSFCATWGAEISDAHMMTIDAAGRLYMVDRDAHELVIFDLHGRRIGGIGARHRPGEMFNHPTDVAVASDGRIYVSDGYGAAKVHVFDPSLRRERSWGTAGSGSGQFSTPHSIALLSDGKVLVADRENHRVQVFSSEGNFLSTWSGMYKPIALFVDRKDFVYVTDETPRLLMFSSDGELQGLCRPTANAAHGVSGDPDGNVYLAAGNPNYVTKLVRLD